MFGLFNNCTDQILQLNCLYLAFVQFSE